LILKFQAREQGFTLIEVLAAMLLLSLAYVAVLESFSASLARVGKLEGHYDRLLEMDRTVLETPLFFPGNEEKDGELYLEGSMYSLITLRSESGLVETLTLAVN
jgi:prepilin-type N-terminal cleavage/methylation domain-containing protein